MFLSYLLQVSSAVPEGKGVSSSAAIEVASMSAIVASHGKNFPSLCQSLHFRNLLHVFKIAMKFSFHGSIV